MKLAKLTAALGVAAEVQVQLILDQRDPLGALLTSRVNPAHIRRVIRKGINAAVAWIPAGEALELFRPSVAVTRALERPLRTGFERIVVVTSGLGIVEDERSVP